MYHIALYENGVFFTQIGGDMRSVAEASSQIERALEGIKGDRISGIEGFRFDRNGTDCALVVINDLGVPIKEQ